MLIIYRTQGLDGSSAQDYASTNLSPASYPIGAAQFICAGEPCSEDACFGNEWIYAQYLGGRLRAQIFASSADKAEL